ncbi:phosphate-starvation-inducible PsiE family protein [Aquifex sp.]
MEELKRKLSRFFPSAISLFMWLIIGIEVLGLFYDIFSQIQQKGIFRVETHQIVIEILNILIIYELFTTLLVAFEEHKIKLSLILDTALIFVIRELLIIIFSYKDISLETGFSYSLVITVLGGMRLLTRRFGLE